MHSAKDASSGCRAAACLSKARWCPCRYNLFGQERIKRQLRQVIEDEELLTALPAQRFPLVANGGPPFTDQQEQAAQQAQDVQPADDVLTDAALLEDNMSVESVEPAQPAAARSRKALLL